MQCWLYNNSKKLHLFMYAYYSIDCEFFFNWDIVYQDSCVVSVFCNSLGVLFSGKRFSLLL